MTALDSTRGNRGRISIATDPWLDHNAEMLSQVVAGYVLVRPAAAPPGMHSAPARIVTISDCIMDDLPRPEFWDWFLDREEAFRAQAAAPADTAVVAVALERNDARELIEEMGGHGQPYFELLQRNVEPAGRLLGYEIVGAEATLDFHSWHCHAYADGLLGAQGVALNELGLFSTLADARMGLAWMCSLPSDQAPAPVPWFVVALFAVTADLS